MSIWDVTKKLNAALFPYLGPAAVGPYDEHRATVKPCPLCGNPMDAHDIERREGRPTQLHCPVVAA